MKAKNSAAFVFVPVCAGCRSGMVPDMKRFIAAMLIFCLLLCAAMGEEARTSTEITGSSPHIEDDSGTHRRMQNWDEQIMAFMRDAEAYNSYTRDLAAWILPQLNDDDAVCEAGCGMGQLALALAGHVRCYTAFDRDPDALCDLIEAAKHVDNLRVECAELGSYRADEPMDVLLLCLVGAVEGVFAAADRLQCDRVIEIIRRTPDALTKRDPSGLDTAALPEGWRLASKESKDLPLNQPFRSFEDARAFADLYIDSTLSDAALQAMLHPVRDGEFRFEFPVTRYLEMRVYKKVQ